VFREDLQTAELTLDAVITSSGRYQEIPLTGTGHFRLFDLSGTGHSAMFIAAGPE
jgi:hypothetical protein